MVFIVRQDDDDPLFGVAMLKIIYDLSWILMEDILGSHEGGQVKCFAHSSGVGVLSQARTARDFAPLSARPCV